MNPFKTTRKQLSIFVTAGYPELTSLPEKLAFLTRAGVDFIEVGIPFSDPLADGPTIQESSNVALRNGMNTSLLFEQLAAFRASVPLVVMSYLNPIVHFGLERFLQRCSETGIRHLIVPDVSLEVYERSYQKRFETMGITLCFLVAPSTSSERVQRMAKHSRNGFIYLVSSSMTTGNQQTQHFESDYKRIKEACGTTPMMIGFGIRTGQDVRRVHSFSDGAIVGSAYIQAIHSGNEAAFIQDVLAY